MWCLHMCVWGGGGGVVVRGDGEHHFVLWPAFPAMDYHGSEN